MSVVIHKIGWTRTFFEVEYTASAGEELFLCRIKTSEWISLESTREGDNVHARVNVVIANGRKPIDAGEWILCQKVDGSLLESEQALYAARPYLEVVVDWDYRRTLPKKDRDTTKGDELVKKNGFSFYKQHPYDVQSVVYDDAVLESLDACQRVFRYSGLYAYTANLIPRQNPNDHLFCIISLQFYIKNDNPKVRKKSRRFREKQILNACFRLFSKLVPKKGNRVLFFKENGAEPTENMAALQQRMQERGLGSSYDIVYRYRNVFGSRWQNIAGWLGDLFEIARADYIFIDDYTPIFNFIDLDDSTTLTQIWHAGVGFKSVGYARFGIAGSPDPYASSHRAYTYALVGNKDLRDIYSEVFGIEKSALLATGMPRLDHFRDERIAEDAKSDLTSRYPWMGDGRVIVFAPTFRGTGQKQAYYPYDSYIDMDALYAMCQKTDSYFVFEMHHFINELPTIPAEYRDRIFDLSSESLNDLYHVADVLVTDYSSCFYDYLLLKKPVVFYVPDKIEYSAIRGVQRSVDELAPGVVCNTFDQFVQVLEEESYKAVKPHPSCIDRCIEGGMLASDRVIDTILLGKDVPGVRLQDN